MSAKIIDGKLLAEQIRQHIKSLVNQESGSRPGLAVILVGENPASQVYVRNKVRACGEVGFHSSLETLPSETTQAQLLARIDALNQDPSIHGILVQLPLPAHIQEQAVIEHIAPQKDVDGFHLVSAGALLTGAAGFRPCTPYGCIKILEHIGAPIAGKHAVIVGRSNIVGKPMAMLLLEKNATVTICHSRTENLAQITRSADILVAAVGKPQIITGDMVKPGAIVLDVGINRWPHNHPLAGKICGDVDFESVKSVASYLTPVPGGVGPMTIAMLLQNTLQAKSQTTV